MESLSEDVKQNSESDTILYIQPEIIVSNVKPPTLKIMSSEVPSIKKREADSPNRKKFETIKNFYMEHGCILISIEKDYKNISSILEFKCKCNNPETCKKTFSAFQSTPRCSNRRYNCMTQQQLELQEKYYLDVATYFSDRGCKLLTLNYSNQYGDLSFICVCKNEAVKTFSNFKACPHCENCKGMTTQDMENFYIKNGCFLLQKLPNVDRTTKRRFVCKCDIEDEKTFHSFEKSPQCDYCDRKDYLSKIEKLFVDNGAYLLSKYEVLNGNCALNDPTLLKYICPCGNDQCEKNLKNFTNVPWCEICTSELLKENGKNLRIPFLEVQNTLKMYDYILLLEEQDYKGTDERLPSLCAKRHPCGVVYSRLKNGCSCCMLCAKDKRVKTCLERYGVENVMYSEEIKSRLTETQFLLYGGHPLNNKEFREKIHATNIKRYGGKGPLSSKEVRDKKDATMIERYGENPMGCEQIRNKYIETCIMKYGVEHPLKCQEIRDKIIATCRAKYGVDHPMQVKEFFDKQRKSAFQHKEYLYPSGNTILVQGYEGFCITDLLQQGYSENQIINDIDFGDKMPEIFYDFNSGRHRYYPDLFIPHENKIIEVKSVYTLNLEREKNIAKALQCKAMGYNFEFRVYGKKGNLLERIVV